MDSEPGEQQRQCVPSEPCEQCMDSESGEQVKAAGVNYVNSMSSEYYSVNHLHRCLQAWAYQGNAWVVGEPYASNLGFCIIDTIQWTIICLPCLDISYFAQAPLII